jgi:hypothetical protein
MPTARALAACDGEEQPASLRAPPAAHAAGPLPPNPSRVFTPPRALAIGAAAPPSSRPPAGALEGPMGPSAPSAEASGVPARPLAGRRAGISIEPPGALPAWRSEAVAGAECDDAPSAAAAAAAGAAAPLDLGRAGVPGRQLNQPCC